MALKNIVVLGSTGSIGINTLDVIARYPDRFRLVGLSAYNNIGLLKSQIQQFSPRFAAVGPEGIKELRSSFSGKKVKVYNAVTDLEDLVVRPDVDVVVIGMSGCRALAPFLSAVKKGKTVAPANKEALVVAGDIIMRAAKKHRARVIPVDSEQSAIFQCLEGQRRRELSKVFLTASGGPLYQTPLKQFDRLTVEKILDHPRWKMGKKITVDSATLMNKGFEVIEAKWLFDLAIDQIEVVVHPEAIVHSMVRFQDGSVLAQLGITDMRLPIQYALTYPQRLKTGLPELDFCKLRRLNFDKPDFRKFPALGLAIDAGRRGGTLPSVLNAADEEAVEAFLNKRIAFTRIYDVVEKVVRQHQVSDGPDLQQILAADKWAREETARIIDRIRR